MGGGVHGHSLLDAGEVMGWGGCVGLLACLARRGGGLGAMPAAAGFGEWWVKAAHRQCLHGVLQELSVPEGGCGSR